MRISGLCERQQSEMIKTTWFNDRQSLMCKGLTNWHNSSKVKSKNPNAFNFVFIYMHITYMHLMSEETMKEKWLIYSCT